VALLLALALARFGQVAYSGLTYSIGDFYSTLPGAYVETFNPTLWNSPDLLDEVGKRPSYRRGPTQLLTTLPLSYLDSYREIALVLLFVYGALILASAYVMWRAFGGPSRNLELLALIVATSVVFYPTLLAYIAREFEVLLLLATVMLFAAARDGRLGAVGTWTAYLSLFKYLPLGLLPLLVARRWWKALVAFALTAAAMLAVTHALFGLHNFSSDGFLGNFIAHLLPGQADTFCMAYQGWHYESNQHEVSLRFALCSARDVVPFPIVPAYLALILATLAALAAGYLRAEAPRGN
jgi:hypothetical protein